MDETTGTCPLCQSEVHLSGEWITCTMNENHFAIKAVVWEAAWEKYSAGVMKPEALLMILRGANLAPDRPGANE
jgi:hypothetical protein